MNFKFVSVNTCLLVVYLSSVSAGELEFKPSISTSIIQSQHDSQRGGDGDASILSIKPSLKTNYTSDLLVGNIAVTHNQIESNISDESQANNFTKYQYSADISLIDKILSLNIAGGQFYRSILSSQYFVNDQYLNSDGLAKTRTNSASAYFTLPSRKYFRFNVNGGASTMKRGRSSASELDIDSNLNSEIDNDNQFFDAQLYQGSEFTRLSWNFSSRYQNTDRATRNNFTSKVFSGEVGFGLFSNIRAIITSSTEENELSNNDELSAGDLSLDSYGVGFSWFESENRKITLTYNQSKRNDQEEENFVGLNLNWSFSRRTSVEANYGKRFYGSSGTFSLSHNTRRFRTRINYGESLTTSSRLITRTEDLGAFVCPIGEFSFNECIVPPSPSYTLQPGEQFSNLFVPIAELNDQVILRKSLNASVGLIGRKINSTLSLAHNDLEYIEADRVQKNNIVTLSNKYTINRKTSLNLTINYALTESETTGIETKTISSNLGFSRKLGRKMSTNLTFKYIDRNSINAEPDQLDFSNSELTDRRLTLEFLYNF